jgi:hypothetical protein
VAVVTEQEITLEQAYDPTIAISGPLGDLVTIDTATGEMTFGENYHPDETAKLFWDAILGQLNARLIYLAEDTCPMCRQPLPTQEPA